MQREGLTVRTQWLGVLGVAMFGLMGGGWAQTPAAIHAEPVTEVASDSVLPDAPEPQNVAPKSTGATEPSGQGGSTGTTTAMADTRGSRSHHHPGRTLASKYTFYIPDDQKSIPLTNTDKWRLVGVESVDGFTFTTAILAAGFEQVINGNPKYGTDSGAFGERLGAAYIRQTSQAVFTEGIGDTLMNDDPRYYVMGRQHRFGKRVLYAASRVIITRSDAGKQRFNTPELLGYLGAAALTQAYYPPSSRGVNAVFGGYGLSLGAAALGFEFHEFLGDALRATHLKRN
jgi:hypothetical protein